jgi:predicted ATP-grasp superfamily ATP-dependent carboligase
MERAAFDLTLPVLFVRVGDYRLHYGTLDGVRSFGEVGIRAGVMEMSSWSPVARSRRLSFRLPIVLDPMRDEADLLQELKAALASIEPAPMLVCTDDEAAVLVAEGASVLADHCVMPSVPSTLPRMLADKARLHELCVGLDIGSPHTAVVRDADSLVALAEEFGYPVVLKSPAAFDRIRHRLVSGTVIVHRREQLESILQHRANPFEVLIQQHLASEHAEDWFVHGYCASSGKVEILFTGRKHRSFPCAAGATALATSEPNDEIAMLTRRLCEITGYRGIFDLDWRIDRADPKPHLLDFNPRLGAQHSLFRTADGLDLLRAMHLDLSGRPIRASAQRYGERFVAENLFVASLLADRHRLRPPISSDGPTHFAWHSSRDPLPELIAIGWQSAAIIRRRFRQRSRDAVEVRVASPIGVVVPEPMQDIAFEPDEKPAPVPVTSAVGT